VTRGRVSSFQLLLGLASEVFLGSVSKSKLFSTDGQSVSQSVCLGIGHPLSGQ
jgi:hypothetical protein